MWHENTRWKHFQIKLTIKSLKPLVSQFDSRCLEAIPLLTCETEKGPAASSDSTRCSRHFFSKPLTRWASAAPLIRQRQGQPIGQCPQPGRGKQLGFNMAQEAPFPGKCHLSCCHVGDHSHLFICLTQRRLVWGSGSSCCPALSPSTNTELCLTISIYMKMM